MTRHRQLLTIKDLAIALGMSTRSVWDNQKNLGLLSTKVRLNARVIRFRRAEVEKLEAFRGIELPS